MKLNEKELDNLASDRVRNQVPEQTPIERPRLIDPFTFDNCPPRPSRPDRGFSGLYDPSKNKRNI